jgi:hypothetical protein
MNDGVLEVKFYFHCFIIQCIPLLFICGVVRNFHFHRSGPYISGGDFHCEDLIGLLKIVKGINISSGQVSVSSII